MNTVKQWLKKQLEVAKTAWSIVVVIIAVLGYQVTITQKTNDTQKATSELKGHNTYIVYNDIMYSLKEIRGILKEHLELEERLQRQEQGPFLIPEKTSNNDDW